MISRVEQLRRAGFDRSCVIPFKKTWCAICSACQVTVINGVPCHERGCSNQAKARRERAQEEA